EQHRRDDFTTDRSGHQGRQIGKQEALMLSLRLVIDTNVVVSAALKSDGLQRTTFLLSITKPGRLYVSTPILEEYAEVLSRPELAIRKGPRLQLLQLIKNHGHLITPSRHIDVTSDPDDNIFVECADAARADFLITGNRKHFPAFWKNTKIITPREFVTLVAPHLVR
ncbi:MAG: putative toxin-antitoxin system toxin component, PIN family, partial [Terracidiphilus sp.]